MITAKIGWVFDDHCHVHLQMDWLWSSMDRLSVDPGPCRENSSWSATAELCIADSTDRALAKEWRRSRLFGNFSEQQKFWERFCVITKQSQALLSYRLWSMVNQYPPIQYSSLLFRHLFNNRALVYQKSFAGSWQSRESQSCAKSPSCDWSVTGHVTRSRK